MEICDLRSDTVTRPSPAMREAMAKAPVGDDVYGEDPSVKALERRVADLLGKERALFVPSGTMANQLALMLHTRRGDDVVIGEGSHCMWFESGAASALSGIQFAIAGSGGLFDANDFEAAVKGDAFYLPRTSLCVIENTHNRAGGRVFPIEQVRKIAEVARRRSIAVHLDGARLWNATTASGVALHEYAACADTVSVAFSKGLGAPVGSALTGSSALMEVGLRFRHMLGGAMRQSGILAAGALFALDNHLERLREDHEKARALAEIVAVAPNVRVYRERVETNMVNLHLEPTEADRLVEAAKQRGVLVGLIAPGTVRAVTHLDVSLDEVRRAGERLLEAAKSIS